MKGKNEKTFQEREEREKDKEGLEYYMYENIQNAIACSGTL
jgi:hypothetical protein